MKILCFGEILFDVYDNSKVLAGAPLNVASISQCLGFNSSIVSAINKNDKTYVENELKKRKITSLVQYSSKKTAEAKVKMKNTVPTFIIDSIAAFDFINFDDCINYNEYDIIYFGTLAQRNKVSKKTLAKIISNSNAMKVYDVNLRPNIKNWFNTFLKCYKISNIIKINENELKEINKKGINILKDAFNYKCKYLIVTYGEKGAILYTKNKFFKIDSEIVKVKDTTGCGDSFLAGFLYGVQFSTKKALMYAKKCSSIVAKNNGAFSKEIKKEIIQKL